MPPRRCVVSLATANRGYDTAYLRLEQSLRAVAFGGEFFGWPPGSFPPRCPSHDDVPFAFKPACLAQARAHGFETALWLDATCVAVKGLETLFDIIEAQSYLLFSNGRKRVGEWASDAALARLGVTRDEAMDIREINAAAIGLSLTAAPGAEFLDRWVAEAHHGEAFRGSAGKCDERGTYDMKWNRGAMASTDPRVRGHRHDQTVAGILAHQLGMSLSERGLETTRLEVPSKPDTVILKRRDTWPEAAR